MTQPTDAGAFAGTVFEDWNPESDQTVQGWVGGGGQAGFDVHENQVSHNIVADAPGQYPAAFVKAGGWHNLGTVIDHPVSTNDLMVAGGLAYEVFRAPAQYTVAGVTYQMPNVWHTYRHNPVTDAVEGLGTVSGAYPIFQNADCFLGFGDAILAETNSRAAACAALFGGRQAFMCWLLDREIKVGDDDSTQLWMMARTSHDKSTPFDVCVAPLRTVCGNTMRFNIRNCLTRWTIRHTRNALAKTTVEDARRSLKMTFAYAEEWEKAMNELVQTEMTAGQFDKIITKVFGPELGASKIAEARWAKRRDTWMTLFTNAPEQENIRGTAYAAVNAVGQWADWGQGTKAKDPAAKKLLTTNPAGYQFARAMVNDDRTITEPKAKILAAVAEWAGVQL